VAADVVRRKEDSATMASELDDLLDAARAAPGSGGVIRALARAAGAAVDRDAAIAFLGALSPDAHAEETRLMVSRLLLDDRALEAALLWAQGPSPALGVARARAELALGRVQAAARAYAQAVAAQPDLADAELEAALSVPAEAPANVVDLRGRPIAPSPAAEAEARPRPEITFADVGGLEAVKSEIRRKIILPFTRKGLFEAFKKRAGGGILLYGPPGCGKTMLARATAGEVDAAFITVAIPDILSKWLGESERKLSDLFAEARRRTPTVLFFDEIEALAGRRGTSEQNHTRALVSTFLSEMDGAQGNNDGVLVLAATNVPWSIDPAFRRQGRFDRVLFVPPPDAPAREAVLKLMLAGRPGAEGVDAAPLARATSGFSSADLAQVVDIACDLAIEESLERNHVAPLTNAHLTQALKATRPTTLEWLTEARNYAKFANEGGLYDDVVRFLDQNKR
jgi:ATP-dependent 26S proteasome regulatory subunit